MQGGNMLTVYGHRGLPSKAPENTIASFKAASEVEGINWLELDVAITKDEQLIIIHDDYLERTTNMSGEITELNYDEIKMLLQDLGLVKNSKMNICQLSMM